MITKSLDIKTYSKLTILNDIFRMLDHEGITMFNTGYEGEFTPPPEMSLYCDSENTSILKSILPLALPLLKIMQEQGVSKFINICDQYLSVPFPDRMTIKTDHGKLCKAEFENVIKHFNNV